MASLSNYIIATIALIVISSSAAFTAIPTRQVTRSTNLYMADGEVKAAPSVSGEELEVMFQDWDTPMVIDAYATWYVRKKSLARIDAKFAVMRSVTHRILLVCLPIHLLGADRASS